MKKIIFTLSLILLTSIGYSQKNQIDLSLVNNTKELNVQPTDKVNISYSFADAKELKEFDLESSIDNLYNDVVFNTEQNCEVTGSIEVTVSGTVGVGVAAVEIEVSITLSVTASCSEIAGALRRLAGTARSIALAQLSLL